MRIENRERESEREKCARQPAGEFHQDVRGLRPEKILRHPAAERRAEALAFRPLHQDHEDHQQRDQHVNYQEGIDQDRHGAGNIAKEGGL